MAKANGARPKLRAVGFVFLFIQTEFVNLGENIGTMCLDVNVGVNPAHDASFVDVRTDWHAAKSVLFCAAP